MVNWHLGFHLGFKCNSVTVAESHITKVHLVTILAFAVHMQKCLWFSLCSLCVCLSICVHPSVKRTHTHSLKTFPEMHCRRGWDLLSKNVQGGGGEVRRGGMRKERNTGTERGSKSTKSQEKKTTTYNQVLLGKQKMSCHFLSKIYIFGGQQTMNR